MTKLFRVLADVISFGILPLLRWLIHRKILRSRINIDLDKDGNSDVDIIIHSNHSQKED